MRMKLIPLSLAAAAALMGAPASDRGISFMRIA